MRARRAQVARVDGVGVHLPQPGRGMGTSKPQEAERMAKQIAKEEKERKKKAKKGKKSKHDAKSGSGDVATGAATSRAPCRSLPEC